MEGSSQAQGVRTPSAADTAHGVGHSYHTVRGWNSRHKKYNEKPKIPKTLQAMCPTRFKHPKLHDGEAGILIINIPNSSYRIAVECETCCFMFSGPYSPSLHITYMNSASTCVSVWSALHSKYLGAYLRCQIGKLSQSPIQYVSWATVEAQKWGAL